MTQRRAGLFDGQNLCRPRRATYPSVSSPFFEQLRTELLQQRTRLMRELSLDAVPSDDAQPCADVADQASMDHARDVSLIGKTRMRERLRDIERALTVMHRHDYGRCVDCKQWIPLSRLRVQPAALLCVACQAAAAAAAELKGPNANRVVQTQDHVSNDW